MSSFCSSIYSIVVSFFFSLSLFSWFLSHLISSSFFRFLCLNLLFNHKCLKLVDFFKKWSFYLFLLGTFMNLFVFACLSSFSFFLFWICFLFDKKPCFWICTYVKKRYFTSYSPSFLHSSIFPEQKILSENFMFCVFRSFFNFSFFFHMFLMSFFC